jgi:hypothetical protein
VHTDCEDGIVQLRWFDDAGGDGDDDDDDDDGLLDLEGDSGADVDKDDDADDDEGEPKMRAEELRTDDVEEEKFHAHSTASR